MKRLELSGGEALQDRLKEIMQKAGKAGTVSVGFMAGATYQDKDQTPIAMVAAIQEYGAPAAGIPSRPFFRNMIAKESPRWGKELGRLAVHTDYDVAQTLDGMGQIIQGQLKESIIEFNSVPLAPATIAKKGFATQLIDTGIMQNAVDYEVKS